MRRIWTLRPYHTFCMAGRYFVYDVLAVAAYEVSSATHEFLAQYEVWPYDKLIEIPRAGSPPRKSLGDEIAAMGLFSEDGSLPALSADDLQDRYKDCVVNELVFALSSGCNLKCVYCYEAQNGFRNSARPMTMETARKAIGAFLDQLGEEEGFLCFMGGETLLRFDLLTEIAEYGRQQARRHGKSLGFKITTNGTLLNDERIGFLKEYGFQVKVSLDGTADYQNKNRPFSNGRGSYDAAAPKIKKLLQAIPECEAQVTSTANAGDFRKILSHHRSLGFKNINFDFAVEPAGDPKFSITNFESIKREVLELGGQRPETGPSDHVLGQLEYLKTVLLERKDSLVSCGAALSVVAVSPEGGLFPCAGFFGVSRHQIGDVNGWIDPAARQRYIEATRVDHKPICRNCWARMACAGGCAMNANITQGSVGGPGQQNCDFLRFQLEAVISKLEAE